eukprot:scaffold66501_cov20-Tisochrysis_lutea.AAC.1
MTFAASEISKGLMARMAAMSPVVYMICTSRRSILSRGTSLRTQEAFVVRPTHKVDGEEDSLATRNWANSALKTKEHKP